MTDGARRGGARGLLGGMPLLCAGPPFPRGRGGGCPPFVMRRATSLRFVGPSPPGHRRCRSAAVRWASWSLECIWSWMKWGRGGGAEGLVHPHNPPPPRDVLQGGRGGGWLGPPPSSDVRHKNWKGRGGPGPQRSGVDLPLSLQPCLPHSLHCHLNSLCALSAIGLVHGPQGSKSLPPWPGSQAGGSTLLGFTAWSHIALETESPPAGGGVQGGWGIPPLLRRTAALIHQCPPPPHTHMVLGGAAVPQGSPRALYAPPT